MENNKEYTESFFLTPAECNPQQRMPITLLVSRIIEVATLHANMWNVGFAKLKEENQTWVLSRITLEMKRYPTVNEYYSLTTWIEGFNKFYSERNLEVRDGKGNVIGYARSVWVIMDIATRESKDMTKFSFISDYISERACPIDRQKKLRPIKDANEIDYQITYCDTDFNRHINSCKYIELFLNQWDLDFHDNYKISRFEIAYMKEAFFGDKVKVRVDNKTLDCETELLRNGEALCRARFKFEKEYYKEQNINP